MARWMTEEQLAAYELRQAKAIGNKKLAREWNGSNIEPVTIKGGAVVPVSIGYLPPDVPLRACNLTLPWPPTGNTAVRHANGVHYLRKEAIEYRQTVAALCAPYACHTGQYILHLTLSPPDRRKRDADNAIKSVLDALKGRLFEDDSMSLMRELHVRVEGYRGEVEVWIEPIEKAAA